MVKKGGGVGGEGGVAGRIVCGYVGINVAGDGKFDGLYRKRLCAV